MADTSKNAGKSAPSKPASTGKRTTNTRTYSDNNGGGYGKSSK